MKRREVHIGPGAASLLLVVVVVSMSVLGLLALMSARSDAQLARRSLEYTVAEYDRAAQAERSLAQLDGVLTACAGEEDYLAAVSRQLPQGMTLDGRVVRWTESGDTGRSLCCAVELAEDGARPRFRWLEHQFMAEEINTDLP